MWDCDDGNILSYDDLYAEDLQWYRTVHMTADKDYLIYSTVLICVQIWLKLYKECSL